MQDPVPNEMLSPEEVAPLRAEIAKLKRLFLDLTPGGSEFYANPERCAQWARDRMQFNVTMAMRHNQYRDTLAAIVRCYDSLSELPASCVSELQPFIEDARALLPQRFR